MNHDDHPVRAAISRSVATIASLEQHTSSIERASQMVIDALHSGNKVLTAGHGGSAADALHMAEEFVGRFIGDRRSLPAVSLVADSALLTCIANDYGYDEVFARQLEGLGQAGDVLVLFSTSGKSPSLRRAIEMARLKRVDVIALLGKGGGPIAGQADVEIIVAGEETARIQEAHTVILHLILEAVERQFA